MMSLVGDYASDSDNETIGSVSGHEDSNKIIDDIHSDIGDKVEPIRKKARLSEKDPQNGELQVTKKEVEVEVEVEVELLHLLLLLLKQKSPSPLLQQLPTPLHLKSEFEIEEEERKEAKRKAKELKRRRKEKGNDPWTSYTDDFVVQPNANTAFDTEHENGLAPNINRSAMKSGVENGDVGDENEHEHEHNDNGEGDASYEFKPTSELMCFSEEEVLKHQSLLQVPTKLQDKLRKPTKTWRVAKSGIVQTIPLAHRKGVNKLQFIPHLGHLLLSCGNDNLIKLWRARQKDEKFELARIYRGHRLAVKDICFNSTGDRFLSCGYDKIIRLWDTETGNVIKTIQVSSVPNVVRFRPEHENEFIAGLSNHEIHHFDIESIQLQSPLQIYDHHVGSINDILVTSEGFISTADDKTVRVWKWRVNSPTKAITGASLFSIPSVKKRPNSKHIVLQSMDNTIKVLDEGKYSWNKKKIFKGHHNAGYGIEIDVAPDGKMVMSGDSRGFVFFWDWEMKKVQLKLKLSDRPIKSVAVQPLKTSSIAAAGISGDIYYCS